MDATEKGLPFVAECTATECAYNVNNNCHARAITIGDGVHPGCDTFFKHAHILNVSQTAIIGACKVVGCKNNQDCQCVGDRVRIGPEKDGAICLTYAA